MSLAQLRVEMVVGMAQLSLKVKWPPLINCPATAIHSRPAIDECICRFVDLASFPSRSIDCSSPWNDARSFLIPFACQQCVHCATHIWVRSDRNISPHSDGQFSKIRTLGNDEPPQKKEDIHPSNKMMRIHIFHQHLIIVPEIDRNCDSQN
jgi:hypothetical protein